ncbi:MAG: siderophore-interacting protein [Hyphomicrobium sp.]
MERTTERVRHELRFRLARVVSNQRITPRMARITLTDPDFATFQSDAYDDHVKLFFAPPASLWSCPWSARAAPIFRRAPPAPKAATTPRA